MTGNKKQIIEWLLDQAEGMFDISVHKDKRSKDANAYYWVLCGKLSQKCKVPAEDLYRKHIRDMSVYECILMVPEAVPSFTEKWKSNHLGRFVTTKASFDYPGKEVVLAYYGSSDFNREQMSRLIDNLHDDCEVYGVDTATPDEMKHLIELWKAS